MTQLQNSSSSCIGIIDLCTSGPGIVQFFNNPETKLNELFREMLDKSKHIEPDCDSVNS